MIEYNLFVSLCVIRYIFYIREKGAEMPLKFIYKMFTSSGRVWETKRFLSKTRRGLCPIEENSEFQGFLADGTRLFIPLLKQVEILIST